jgi:hypothetical protein
MKTSGIGTGQGRLPNFLLIGAMKAGTTSLYHYLQSHPQIFVPVYKAPEFFVAESNLRRGVDWYRRQFAGAGEDKIAVGEASNAYAKFPVHQGVPERVAKYIPKARLIYIVRDPIERVRSHYQHRVNERAERRPFEEAVFTDPFYLSYSRYALQIERYLEFFPREQILVITTDELRNERAQTMSRVYDFLGVEAACNPAILEREYYRTKDRNVRSLIPLRLRKALKRHIPASRRFKELETNMCIRIARWFPCVQNARERESFVISDDIRQRLADELRDDMQRLKSYMPPGFSAWNLA